MALTFSNPAAYPPGFAGFSLTGGASALSDGSDATYVDVTPNAPYPYYLSPYRMVIDVTGPDLVPPFGTTVCTLSILIDAEMPTAPDYTIVDPSTAIFYATGGVDLIHSSGAIRTAVPYPQTPSGGHAADCDVFTHTRKVMHNDYAVSPVGSLNSFPASSWPVGGTWQAYWGGPYVDGSGTGADVTTYLRIYSITGSITWSTPGPTVTPPLLARARTEVALGVPPLIQKGRHMPGLLARPHL